MIGFLVTVAIGGAIGSALGYMGKCGPGGCPLTANWRRGAAYGAVLGALFHVAMGQGDSGSINQSTPHIQRVGESEFEAVVRNSKQPVVVDFYAVWCGPCKALSPKLEKLASQHPHIKFVKVNVDESRTLASRYSIQGVPTLLLFENGNEVHRFIGLSDPVALTERLREFAPAGETVPSHAN